MAFIPLKVKKQAIIPSLRDFLLSQGKVGDIYQHPQEENLLISVRSDRLSVFDFVLPLLVKHKGAALTKMTEFFDQKLLKQLGMKNHLVYSREHRDLNMVHELKEKYPDIDMSRTLVIQKAKIMQYELIFRHHIGGSVWNKYLKDGIVAGVQLPEGLKKWQQIEVPLFTPSTKAETGHDINITANEFFEATSDAGQQAVEMLTLLYRIAYNSARKKGILILDTKFEFGILPNGTLVICDEWLTPDSSRYVSEDNLRQSIAAGIEPAFMDKQPVRDFCAKIETPFLDKNGKQIVGFKNLDPENLEHLKFVSNYPLPKSVATATTKRYVDITKRITGLDIAA
jgi:phosphoribosylaminoimidazole-succinocarboxamide synthase